MGGHTAAGERRTRWVSDAASGLPRTRITAYQRRLAVTHQVVQQVQQVPQLQTPVPPQAERLNQTLQRLEPRIQQVIRQTTPPVIQGTSVPAGEKRVSLFEANTAMIRRGKAGTPVEFGRVLWLAETEGGVAVGNVGGVDDRGTHRTPSSAACGIGAVLSRR